MVREIENNLILINAPAGSGKTTTIEKNIINTLSNFPNSKILCITYTNRAADELLSRINNNNVQIQTIHSYINEFINIYFTHEDVLELYFEIYGDKIKSDIINEDLDSRISDKNNRYKQKQKVSDEEFCFETVKKYVTKINYNELSFNSLYYGGLCHDDLLSFSRIIINKFPVLQKRIVDKYNYIYIDEYQDTSANVLDIFYNAAIGTETKLYLLGDKMQQIYKNYDGSFEEELQKFDTSQRLSVNYRSGQKIVDVLNKIYNDEKFIQDPNEADCIKDDYINPKIIISKDVEMTLNDEKIIKQNTLKLFIFNRARFKAVNAENLYVAISGMDKYSNISKYSAVEVLTNKPDDNPDELMRYLLLISDAIENLISKKYGAAIQNFKNHEIFNFLKLEINVHDDKIKFREEMTEMCNEYYTKDHTIKSFLEMMISKNILIEDKFISIFENQEYENFLKVDINEFRNLKKYLQQPYVSTQHGVKGEGYDSVCFIAENSSNPPANMYGFFELFCKQNINLTEFQNFYYYYVLKLQKFENDEIKCKLSKLKAPEFKLIEQKLTEFLQRIKNEMEKNIYFNFIFLESFNKYLNNPNVTNVKPCLATTQIFSILTAYRLFYVGCSRARKDLTIVIDSHHIESFANNLKIKMKEIGFDIV